MSHTVTIICPVFNEAAVIESFYRELRRVLDLLATRYEADMLFVVDRCSDATPDILQQIATRDRSVKILFLSSRFGHQASLLAGMDHVRADITIMMDCDLQHPPSLIPELLAEFEKGYDVVYTIRKDPPGTSFLKRATSRLFYRLINRISDVPINESAADFRLVSRRVVAVFQKEIRERNQFLRGLFSWVGFRSTGVAYTAGERQGGTSKYSLTRMIRFAMHGLVSFSKGPLQAAVVLGFLFATFGLLFAAVTFVQYFLYTSLPSGWTTLAILISVFSGVQLIFLGLIGEYIGAIFDEVKARPHYLVEQQVNFDDD